MSSLFRPGDTLTNNQRKLRMDFRRGMRVIIRGSSTGIVRGYEGNYVKVLCEGPAVFGLAMFLRADISR